MRFKNHPKPALTTFAALFASQAGLLVLTPLLPHVALELGVSTAAAGGLRVATGLAGAVVAMTIGAMSRRFGLRDLIAVGLLLVGLGSATGAAAPSFEVLAVSQLAFGAGNAVVISSGLAAAARWSAEGERTPVLSWALLGQPASWIIGMPIVGWLAGSSWRLSMCMPLVASAVALAIVLSRESDRPDPSPRAGISSLLRRDRSVARWAIGELLAFAGWGGSLTFAGALMIESYDPSPALVGALLGLAAIAYFPGNLLARRWAQRAPRSWSARLGGGLSILLLVFGTVRPGLTFSLGLFALMVMLAGARALAGTAAGLEAAARQEVPVMGIRASAMQLGMVGGAALGGVALAAGGYELLGVTLSGLFGAGALSHAAGGRESVSRPTDDRQGAATAPRAPAMSRPTRSSSGARPSSMRSRLRLPARAASG